MDFGVSELAIKMRSLTIEKKSDHRQPEQIHPDYFQLFKKLGIWEKVLEYIDDPKDIAAAYGSCNTFADIVEEKRKKVLLPDVVKILISNGDIPEIARPEVNGVMQPVIINPDLLALSSVCQSLHQSISTNLYQSQYQGDDDWHLEYRDRMIPNERCIIIENANDLDRTFAKLQKTKGAFDSFMFRKLVIREDRWGFEEMWEFREGVYRLLKEFLGPFVWTLHYYSMDTSPAQFETRTTKWTRETPNLKVLKLALSATLFESPPALERMDRNFPVLPLLRILKSDHNVSPDFILDIIEKNPTLKRILLKNLMTAAPNPRIINRLSNVFRHLKLDILRLDNFDWSVATSFLDQFALPLKKLKMTNCTTTLVNFDQAFGFFEKYKDTITHLDFTGVQLSRWNGRRNLELPQLTRIGAQLDTTLNTIDFMINLKKLKKMDIHIQYHPLFYVRYFPELIRFKGVIFKLFKESNIGEIFKSLVHVKIKMFFGNLHFDTIIARRNVFDVESYKMQN